MLGLSRGLPPQYSLPQSSQHDSRVHLRTQECLSGHIRQLDSVGWKGQQNRQNSYFCQLFFNLKASTNESTFFFFDGESTLNGLFFYVICSKNGYMYPQLRKSGHRGWSPFSPKFLSTQLPLANFSVQEKLTITEFLNLIYRPNSTCLWESVFLPG